MTEIRSPATPERRSGAPAPRKSLPGRLALYYRQVVSELRKVIWPTQRELITYTIVVLVFVLILMTIVGLLDLGLAKLAFAIFA
ncbi:MAG: preprotein translocase subunit SecE [Actinomycetes bacterium]